MGVKNREKAERAAERAKQFLKEESERMERQHNVALQKALDKGERENKRGEDATAEAEAIMKKKFDEEKVINDAAAKKARTAARTTRGRKK